MELVKEGRVVDLLKLKIKVRLEAFIASDFGYGIILATVFDFKLD